MKLKGRLKRKYQECISKQVEKNIQNKGIAKNEGDYFNFSVQFLGQEKKMC